MVDILIFTGSIREGDFTLYIQSLRNLLDHYHYARWLTVHVFDLISLNITRPDIDQRFEKRLFSFSKTKPPFSRMALDQVHEQNNKTTYKSPQWCQFYVKHPRWIGKDTMGGLLTWNWKDRWMCCKIPIKCVTLWDIARTTKHSEAISYQMLIVSTMQFHSTHLK